MSRFVAVAVIVVAMTIIIVTVAIILMTVTVIILVTVTAVCTVGIFIVRIFVLLFFIFRLIVLYVMQCPQGIHQLLAPVEGEVLFAEGEGIVHRLVQPQLEHEYKVFDILINVG